MLEMNQDIIIPSIRQGKGNAKTDMKKILNKIRTKPMLRPKPQGIFFNGEQNDDR
jgi:hypothetical protein